MRQIGLSTKGLWTGGLTAGSGNHARNAALEGTHSVDICSEMQISVRGSARRVGIFLKRMFGWAQSFSPVEIIQYPLQRPIASSVP